MSLREIGNELGMSHMKVKRILNDSTECNNLKVCYSCYTCYNKNEKMSDYRYILEKYSGMNSRFTCPKCQQEVKTFVRYVDTLTEKYVHPSVGRCNKEDKCGYHFTPKQYFKENNIDPSKTKPDNKQIIVNSQHKKVSYIPSEIFQTSLKNRDRIILLSS